MGSDGSLSTGDMVPNIKPFRPEFRAEITKEETPGYILLTSPQASGDQQKTLISDHGMETMGRVVLFGIILHTTQ